MSVETVAVKTAVLAVQICNAQVTRVVQQIVEGTHNGCRVVDVMQGHQGADQAIALRRQAVAQEVEGAGPDVDRRMSRYFLLQHGEHARRTVGGGDRPDLGRQRKAEQSGATAVLKNRHAAVNRNFGKNCLGNALCSVKLARVVIPSGGVLIEMLAHEGRSGGRKVARGSMMNSD